MKKFIIMLAFTLAMAMGVSMWSTAASKAVGPEVTTTLALEQFADPSKETDTAQRVWNGLDVTTMVVAGSIIFVGGLWLVVYRREIVTLGKVIAE